jgi:hypothetical protein
MFHLGTLPALVLALALALVLARVVQLAAERVMRPKFVPREIVT